MTRRRGRPLGRRTTTDTEDLSLPLLVGKKIGGRKKGKRIVIEDKSLPLIVARFAKRAQLSTIDDFTAAINDPSRRAP